MSISKGETLGLVGESGCGKTTLSRCILGLERANSGSIEFDGIDVQHASAKVLKNLRRDMQIVFQDPFTSLDPRWSVRRIIEEPLQVHNIVPKSQRNAEIVRLLETVGLPSTVMTRYPHEFSGGQRQRIGIARALASRPRFLIADEPVSALDISIRAHILNLLRDIQRERSLSILFIAHDLAAVKQVSNRIAVMYKGVIMEEGPADNLFTDTRHPYTRGLIDSIPMIKPIKQDLDARPANQQSLTANSKASDCCVYTDKCKYVQDLCLNSKPDLVEISQTHNARCHYANQLRLGLFASSGEIAGVEFSEAVV